MFYSNPECKTQCEGLPNSVQCPSHGIYGSGISLPDIGALISPREDVFLLNLSHEYAHCSLSAIQSLPPGVWLAAIATITPQVTTIGTKIATRIMRILLDPRYMACNRAIMTTCMIVRSSQIAEANIAAEVLTTQNRIYNQGQPIYCCIDDIAWKIQSLISLRWLIAPNALTSVESLYWTKKLVENSTHPYIGMHLIAWNLQRHGLVQNTHFICCGD